MNKQRLYSYTYGYASVLSLPACIVNAHHLRQVNAESYDRSSAASSFTIFTLQECGCVTLLTPVFKAQLTKGELVTFLDEFQLRCDAQQFARQLIVPCRHSVNDHSRIPSWQAPSRSDRASKPRP